MSFMGPSAHGFEGAVLAIMNGDLVRKSPIRIAGMARRSWRVLLAIGNE